MRYISIWLFGLVCFAFAGQRIERVVKPDTVMTIDTTYSVRYDTLIITATYRDTSLFMKQDTTRKFSKQTKIKIKK